LLAQIYLWQSSILYFELYESLLEDIHLIDVPAIILEELLLYFLVTNIIFFILIAIFLFNLSPKLVNTISQEKFVLNNHFISNNLKERSPPLK
jgi:cellulose synthase/poly-beta-1,6-N-acetylglucosamine synthase-like glycosyltransferase